MYHSLDLHSKTKQQIILLKQLIHKKIPGAPSSFYKCQHYYLILLRARDKNTNCGKREEANIGSKSSAQPQQRKSKGYRHATGGRENSIANWKDNDIRIQMVFPAATAEGAQLRARNEKFNTHRQRSAFYFGWLLDLGAATAEAKRLGTRDLRAGRLSIGSRKAFTSEAERIS